MTESAEYGDALSGDSHPGGHARSFLVCARQVGDGFLRFAEIAALLYGRREMFDFITCDVHHSHG